MKRVHTHIQVEDIGSQVNCDICNEEFKPGDPRQGGFLFCSKAYCPDCANRSMPNIVRYSEQGYIKAFCPEGMTFHEWVMRLRDGNNTVKVIVKEVH